MNFNEFSQKIEIIRLYKALGRYSQVESLCKFPHFNPIILRIMILELSPVICQRSPGKFWLLPGIFLWMEGMRLDKIYTITRTLKTY